MAISLFSVLLEQVAIGKARTAQLLDQVKQGEFIRYKETSARFVKRGKNDFYVEFVREGQEPEITNTSTPVESKLLVLEYLVEEAKHSLEEEEQTQEPPADQPDTQGAGRVRLPGQRRR